MTINKDLHNQVSVGVAIALTAVADGEDVVGAAIDCQGSEGLEIIFQVGAYTDGSVTPPDRKSTRLNSSHGGVTLPSVYAPT